MEPIPANQNPTSPLADFGFERVTLAEKRRRVGEVFGRVADYYDRMNDAMSFGMHRLWKRSAAEIAAVRPGMRVLDLAGGSGDMAILLASKVGEKGAVVLADISGEMLQVGAKRAANSRCGRVFPIQCDAESLPFASRAFDRVVIAFGLRNIADKSRALSEIVRVLRGGGVGLILEFSQPCESLRPLHKFYLRRLPMLGKIIADDSASYRYLAESILRHPSQSELSAMMLGAGFDESRWLNFCGGAVALHIGRRLS